MTPGALGLGRISQIALAVAVLFGVGLIVAGFVAPLYSSESASSSGEVTRGTATLVEMNGAGVLVALSLPLVMAVVVGCALSQRRRRGAVALAWTVTGLLGVFTLLAMLSIGVFILPVTAALIVACGTAGPSMSQRKAPVHPVAPS